MMLGAGASAAAGVPAAWEVQEDLLTRLAMAKGEHPRDIFEWFEAEYDQKPSYDHLLDALAGTRQERQHLLRSYFEPRESEAGSGLKVPTPAHLAIARLVEAGYVRIILTTNFDRLAEAALRTIGVEPVVVASTDDIAGLAPLHSIRCLVVHLHGDYLSPGTMLNTESELESYPEPLNRLLDRIFDEYGLVIAGWSARYDTALRGAWSRCVSRRFSSFWIDPHPLSPIASELALSKSTILVQDTADHFLSRVADAASAISETGQLHPASAQAAVAMAKVSLATQATPIVVHDLLKEELDRVHESQVIQASTWDSADLQTEHHRRTEVLLADTATAVALIATLAHWGNRDTDNWWFGELESLGVQPHVSGSSALIQLATAPATLILHAAGTAATAAGRWDLVARLLTEPQVIDPYTGKMVAVADRVDPDSALGVKLATRWLFGALAPACRDHLGLGDVGFLEAWERFQYIDLVAASVRRLRDGSGRGVGLPHMRAIDLPGREYAPFPSSWFRRLSRSGHARALQSIAETDALLAAADSVDEQFAAMANRIAWSRLPSGGGTLPSGTWFPDEFSPN